MTASSSRRSFLRLAALSSLATSASAFEPIRRVGGASFQPGLNAYSFLEQLKANATDPKTGIDLFGVCDFAAKQNIAAVDLTGYFFPGYPAAPADTYVNRIKKHTHDLGLDISGTGVRNDFATADKAARAEGVAADRAAAAGIEAT